MPTPNIVPAPTNAPTPDVAFTFHPTPTGAHMDMPIPNTMPTEMPTPNIMPAPINAPTPDVAFTFHPTPTGAHMDMPVPNTMPIPTPTSVPMPTPDIMPAPINAPTPHTESNLTPTSAPMGTPNPNPQSGIPGKLSCSQFTDHLRRPSDNSLSTTSTRFSLGKPNNLGQYMGVGRPPIHRRIKSPVLALLGLRRETGQGTDRELDSGSRWNTRIRALTPLLSRASGLRTITC
jgi:hypothetical protein